MLEAFKALFNHIHYGGLISQRFQGIKSLESATNELKSLNGSSPTQFMKSVPEILRILETFEQELHPYQSFHLLEVVTNNVQICFDAYEKEGIQLIIRMCVFLCKTIARIINEGASPFLNLDFQEKYPNLQIFELENPTSALAIKNIQLFGRLVTTIEFGTFLQTIKTQIYELGEKGDWKMKSAALIIFAEFYQITQFKQLVDVFAYLINNLANADLRVRYYAVYSIGLSYTNFKKKFEKKYLQQLIPIIISGIQSDTEIVSCQWIWLFVVLAQNSSKNPIFKLYIDQITNRICQLINLNNQYITEKCIQSLQSLTQVSRFLSKTTIQKYLQICHTILASQNLSINKYLIQRCCYCMTTILSESSPSTAKSYIEIVAQNIWKFSNQMGIDWFHLCWQDLCSCGVTTINWKLMFEKVLSYLENSDLKDIDLNNAYKSIVDTVDIYRNQYAPFSQRTLKFLFSKLKIISQNDEELCNYDMISLGLQKVIEFARPTENMQKWENDVCQILHFVISKATQFQFDGVYDLRFSLLELLKLLLKQYGKLLRSNEIDSFIEKLWKLSNFLVDERNIQINLSQTGQFSFDYDKKAIETTQNQNEKSLSESQWDDLQDSSISEPQKQFVSINECLTRIPDIFQTLFEYTADKSLLVHRQQSQVERRLTQNISFWDLLHVSHFICSFIEHYPYQLMKQKWNYFNSFIEKFILHPNSEIRQIVVFILGVFIQKTPLSLVSLQLVHHWVSLTKQCFLIEKNDQVYENSFDLCQDNCISALGKILFRFGQTFSLIDFYSSWLAKLPLKHDQLENTIQITNIFTLLTTNSVFSHTLSLESILLLLKVFASLKSALDERQKTHEVLKLYHLAKESIDLISKKQIFVENQENLLGGLNDDEKEDLNVLMNEY